MNNKELPLEKRQIVAKIIKEARRKKGLSMEAFANSIGVATSTIFRIENCKFSPNADQLYIILEALELELKINNKVI